MIRSFVGRRTIAIGLITTLLITLFIPPIPSGSSMNHLQVVAVNPEDGSNQVDVNTTIEVTFTGVVEAGEFFDLITIRDELVNIQYDVKILGDIVRLTPSQPLAYSSTYTVFIPQGSLQGKEGEALAETYFTHFTTVSSPELPTVDYKLGLETSGLAFGQENKKDSILSIQSTDGVGGHPLFQDITISGNRIFGIIDGGLVMEIDPVNESHLLLPDRENLLENVVAISYYGHSAIVKEDGTVWTWGINSSGELGDGTTIDREHPTQVVDQNSQGYLSNIVAVSSGSQFTASVKSDGTVWVWGRYSARDVPPPQPTPVPMRVNGTTQSLTSIISISSNGEHTIALRGDGTVWSWGGGMALGDNLTNGQIIENGYISAIQVRGSNGQGFLTDVVDIQAGIDYSVALKSDGTVWSWGINGGSLGDGTTSHTYFPVQVKGNNGVGFLSDVVAIATGNWHTLALKSDGTVWSWGSNHLGQLGDTTRVAKNAPVQVRGNNGVGYLTDIVAVRAGGNGSVAVHADGTVLYWGFGIDQPQELNNLLHQDVAIEQFDREGTELDRVSVPFSTFLQSGSSFDQIQLFKGEELLPIDIHTHRNELIIIPLNPLDYDSNYSVVIPEGAVSNFFGTNVNEYVIYNFTTYQHLNLSTNDYFAPIAAGTNHTMAIPSDGSVWSWGRNNYGQLGIGSTANHTEPVKTLGNSGTGYLTNIVAVTGTNHTVALKSDGTVWSWGYNYYGQLGNGMTSNRNTPVQVKGVDGEGYLTDIVSISAGTNFTVALESDGRMWSWGLNSSGQLGDGTTTTRTTPVQVKGANDQGKLVNVISVQAGGTHAMALLADGTVWAWGHNGSGQLGNGTLTASPVPVQVKGVSGQGYLEDIVAISAGGSHSIALSSDGTVWAWGFNSSSQLGDGTTTRRTLPVQVKGASGQGYLENIVSVSTGSSHTIALGIDGTVWAWGNNSSGRLGDGTTTRRAYPVAVTGMDGIGSLENILFISAGDTYSVALQSDGTVWSWGYNLYGQLGIGTTSTSTTPRKIDSLRLFSPLIMIETTPEEGENGVSMFATIQITFNNEIEAGSKFTGITLRDEESMVNSIVNMDGQVLTVRPSIALEPSTSYTLHLPASSIHGVDGERLIQAFDLHFTTNIFSIKPQLFTGTDFTVALKVDGTVGAWGRNQDGQLGDGTQTPRTLPVQVKAPDGQGFLQDIIAISGGMHHTIALKRDGTVWTWGQNNQGQLGDGTTSLRMLPVQVHGANGIGYLEDIVAITGGVDTSFALRADGTVWAWGRNRDEELGDGTTTTRLTPVQVRVAEGEGYLTDIIAIDAGKTSHTLALRADGTVWAWGSNRYGLLGNGTFRESSLAIPVKDTDGEGLLEQVTAIIAGSSHNLVLKADGTVWAWGNNTHGQLGDGTYTNRLYPVRVTLPNQEPLTDIVAISSRAFHSIALQSDGTLWTWGYNHRGQLGDGTTTKSPYPKKLQDQLGMEHVQDILAVSAGDTYTMVLRENGTLWGWGENAFGQLGVGHTLNSFTPVQALLPVQTRYTYNASNQLTEITYNLGLLVYRTTLTYDSNGNLLTRETEQLALDS